MSDIPKMPEITFVPSHDHSSRADTMWNVVCVGCEKAKSSQWNQMNEQMREEIKKIERRGNGEWRRETKYALWFKWQCVAQRTPTPRSLSFSLRWPHDSVYRFVFSQSVVAADSNCVCVTCSLHRSLVEQANHAHMRAARASSPILHFSSSTLFARAFTAQAHSIRSAAPRS